jgi:NAD-dependent dihydropyrimidine dehydrogenase PreA subunit
VLVNPKHFYATPIFIENPLEEENKMVKIVVNNHKCTGCGTCVDTCPVGVYEIKEGKSVPVKPEECLVCRACEAQCPENAIQVIE